MKRTRPKLRISSLSGVTTETRILAFRYFGTTSGVVIWEGDYCGFPFDTLQNRQLLLFVLSKRSEYHNVAHVMNGSERRIVRSKDTCGNAGLNDIIVPVVR
jgi:hypothetical protein